MVKLRSIAKAGFLVLGFGYVQASRPSSPVKDSIFSAPYDFGFTLMQPRDATDTSAVKFNIRCDLNCIRKSVMNQIGFKQGRITENDYSVFVFKEEEPTHSVANGKDLRKFQQCVRDTGWTNLLSMRRPNHWVLTAKDGQLENYNKCVKLHKGLLTKERVTPRASSPLQTKRQVTKRDGVVFDSDFDVESLDSLRHPRPGVLDSDLDFESLA